MGKIKIRSKYRGRTQYDITEAPSAVDSVSYDYTPGGGGGGGDYPNEPAGMILVARNLCNVVPTSPSSKPAGWTNSWGRSTSSNLDIITDATAPINGPDVLRLTFPSGLNPGSAPFNYFTGWDASGGLTEDIDECSELFIAYTFKIHGNGTNYENQAVGTKFGWISGPNVTGANNDFFFLLTGTGTTGTVTQVTSPRLNQQNITARNLTPNVTTEPFVVGEWCTLEAYFVTNTMGVSNGIYKQWNNGVLTSSYTDVKWRGETSTVRAEIISVTDDNTIVIGPPSGQSVHTVTSGMNIAIRDTSAGNAVLGRPQVTTLTGTNTLATLELSVNVSGMAAGDTIQQTFFRKFEAHSMNPTWGGTGGASKTRDDYIYMADQYVSGKI